MKTTITNHGASVPLERIEQPTFTLPPPPPGMEWHRADGWTEEDLPPGTRPHVSGEADFKDDEARCLVTGKWDTINCNSTIGSSSRISHRRTTRPLFFTHLGHEWTYHRPGDPMPCDGERIVQIVLHTGEVNRDGWNAKFADWHVTDPNHYQIIGWRYADVKDERDALRRNHDISECSKGHKFRTIASHPAKNEREWKCPHCAVKEREELRRENTAMREAIQFTLINHNLDPEACIDKLKPFIQP